MEFNKIRKRKRPNYIRAIIYIIILLIIIYLWLNADVITENLFGKQE